MSKRREKVIRESYEDRFKHDCYNDVHYFIDEEKKVIVCKLEPYADSFMCECNLDFRASINKSFFEYCGDNDISFIGKAICMEQDTFDVSFGKKVAYDKAMFKLLDSKRRFFEHIIKDMKSNIDLINEEIKVLDNNREQVSRRYEAKMKEITK